VRRFHYVDLLRGLAALAVLICHYRWFYARFPNDFREGVALPAYGLLWPIYEYGQIAVPLFWVLSGFVFVVAYGTYGKELPQRLFWVHRVSRLYPLHLLTLFIVAALEIFSLSYYGHWSVLPNNDLRHFILQIFFASNWFTTDPSFNAPIWSVSIEVLVYFAFLLYLRRAGLSLGAAIALSAFGAVAALVTHSKIGHCVALFFAGVAIGIVTPWAEQRIGRWLPVIAGVGIAALAVLGWGIAALGHGNQVYTLMTFVGTVAVLILFISLDLNARELPKHWHWIGLSTYSVYLWHMPLIIAVKIAWGSWIPPFLSSPVPLLVYIATVVAFSLWSYRHIEAPAQTWLRQRLGDKRTPARPEAAHVPVGELQES
jgi:peptidoglycan/LPS O-acetylase OafA/YrhL